MEKILKQSIDLFGEEMIRKEVEVVMPSPRKKESFCKKKQRELRCRLRAVIEGLISHLKHDHRFLRNYLKGTFGDQINTLMAAAAYNMMKWMRLKQQKLLFFLLRAFCRMILFAADNIQSSRA